MPSFLGDEVRCERSGRLRTVLKNSIGPERGEVNPWHTIDFFLDNTLTFCNISFSLSRPFRFLRPVKHEWNEYERTG